MLLGVTGGIASYKSVALARSLTQAGAEVDVVLTRSAQEFVGAVTFEALTGRPVHTALIAPGHALDHIRLARAADLIVVAPATADFLAQAAHGFASELLSAILLAATAPVLVVPAMNDRMWGHPQTTRNVTHLREIGYRVLDPASGELAVGEGSGPGRMPEPETIMAHVGRLLEPSSALSGRRILVTAGPTREAVDPVRYLSNRSSGKMGVAIAESAWRRGAAVHLIAGPVSVPLPDTFPVERVVGTRDMLDAVVRGVATADVLVMAAAPADFRPAVVADGKIKKAAAPESLALTATPDILRETVSARRAGLVAVGFALETDDGMASARTKLSTKSLDLIVLNNAREAGAGFEGDTNRVTFLTPDGASEELPLLSKRDVADVLLDRIEVLLRGR
ncbi:MAG: bifunctional phosphopantothenoylcysteine decarboxylase/phosphopantothenate--cysteine ligase CoaBC [Gemmatimonadaceae bacterium]|nr:bifunctional phosphopantothenoylcysteine decarboxylase/phosphopantothenate--cysteine ligase CoaBC [Gemmatimonadaceae bacterium]